MAERALERRVDEIVVGERIRKDYGDLDALEASVCEQGLLQPIVIRSDGRLVAGERRLEVARRLGWDEIPVYVRDDLDSAAALLKAERDENTCREGFKPSEAVELARRLQEVYGPEAEARRRENLELGGNRPGTRDSRFPASPLAGRTDEKVAPAVGMGATKLREATAVVEAADRGVPGAAEAVEEMDKTGKVSASYKQVFPTGRSGVRREAAPSVDVAIDDERQRRAAELAKERVDKLLGTCQGVARAPELLKLEHAGAVATAAEMKGWLEVFAATRKALLGLEKRTRRLIEDG